MEGRKPSDERRRELTPRIAHAFAELGYRRATTADLARRCGVRENVLYRLWRDKRAMFLAAIEHVYDSSMAAWRNLKPRPGQSLAECVLEYESHHHGEFGLYRIVFAGLSETDDADVRAALRTMYSRFVEFVTGRLAEAHADQSGRRFELAAWGLVGLATAVNISHELELLTPAARRRLLRDGGRLLMGAD